MKIPLDLNRRFITLIFFMQNQSITPSQTPPRSRLDRGLLFLLLTTVIFSFPNKPSFDLDASWRMALSQFFIDGLQFGQDVVFTYGPLGFVMGKTYSGLLFWSLLTWQLFAALSFAAFLMLWGERLAGWPRILFYAFFVLFAAGYDDALYMLMIALMGLELVRRSGQPWRGSSALLVAWLALLSTLKFTNLTLASCIIVVTTALALWHHRRGEAIRITAWYGGAFLVVWMLCRQSPLNIPAYLANSWFISQGYQEAMGITGPDKPFWTGLVVVTILLIYLTHYWLTQKERPRATAYSAILVALLYLGWKHGFIRADGHMIGFFYSALLAIVTYPILLGDNQPTAHWPRWALVGAGLLCLIGIRDTLPRVVDSAFDICQRRIWKNIGSAVQPSSIRAEYDTALTRELALYSLPQIKKTVGQQSVDVLGHDQATAIYNKFNYRARPVFQSYSVYTPELAQLNANFYASERAPDFVLLKVNSIDQRLAAMDDSAVLNILAQRYAYLLSENGFQLWQKNPGAFNSAAAAPRLLMSQKLSIGEPWTIQNYNPQPLWLTIDLRPSLLGRLRTFFYKPPFIQLVVQDTNNNISRYRMPAPMGRAGFIINPIIDDLMAYIRFTGGKPDRLIRQISLSLEASDQKYFAASATATLSSLQPSTAGAGFFAQNLRDKFYMFKTPPVSYNVPVFASPEQIDHHDVMIMHAPSEMVFDVPRGALLVKGQHGFIASAYANNNHTNGAEFVIVWSDGKDSAELYRKYLNPLSVPEDRGLISFELDLKNRPGGRLYFKILPGLYNDTGWDWTGWTGIEIK